MSESNMITDTGKFKIDESSLPRGSVVIRPPLSSVPVIVVPTKQRWGDNGGGPESFEFQHSLARSIDKSIVMINGLRLLLRGTSLDNLPSVMRTGVDVSPTDAVIWASDDPMKCLEYGPLLAVYDARFVHRTFRVIDADTSPEEIARLRMTFPTCVRLKKRPQLWLSRLPEGDPGLASNYEANYGYWISGDARKALIGVIAIGDKRRIAELLLDALGSDSSPKETILFRIRGILGFSRQGFSMQFV